MLEMLLRLQSMGQHASRRGIGRLLDVRGRLTGVVPDDSRIFDQLFLQRASNVVKNYRLNEASHKQLGRKECKALRTELFEGRMLHDLLAGVQRPGDGSS